MYLDKNSKKWLNDYSYNNVYTKPTKNIALKIKKKFPFLETKKKKIYKGMTFDYYPSYLLSNKVISFDKITSFTDSLFTAWKYSMICLKKHEESDSSKYGLIIEIEIGKTQCFADLRKKKRINEVDKENKIVIKDINEFKETLKQQQQQFSNFFVDNLPGFDKIEKTYLKDGVLNIPFVNKPTLSNPNEILVEPGKYKYKIVFFRNFNVKYFY